VQDYFLSLARAGAWANGILGAELAELSPGQWLREHSALNFKSLAGVANHLLLADHLWLHRLTGEGEALASVAVIAHADIAEFQAARAAQDARVLAFVAGLPPERLGQVLHFRTIEGTPRALPVSLCVGHMLNHQTHHRGQMHALLGVMGIACPDIDLLHSPAAKEAAAQAGA
jgi:uncharacterized damage-inducible protein DinB